MLNVDTHGCSQASRTNSSSAAMAYCSRKRGWEYDASAMTCHVSSSVAKYYYLAERNLKVCCHTGGCMDPKCQCMLPQSSFVSWMLACESKILGRDAGRGLVASAGWMPHRQRSDPSVIPYLGSSCCSLLEHSRRR